jgi:hypothetical protein
MTSSLGVLSNGAVKTNMTSRTHNENLTRTFHEAFERKMISVDNSRNIIPGVCKLEALRRLLGRNAQHFRILRISGYYLHVIFLHRNYRPFMKKPIANQNGRQQRRRAATGRQDERKDQARVHSAVRRNSGASYCMCAEMY